MKIRKVADYHAMSVAGADIIYAKATAALTAGKAFNLGLATGNTIRNTMHMIENGYERDKMITMLLWLLLIVYSAQRVYEVNRDRKKINNNKTR